MRMKERPYHRYWGKVGKETGPNVTYHLLPYHGLDVAAVGKVLFESNGLKRRFSKLTGWDENICSALIPFFLALHDLGKFSEGFQNLQKELFEKLRGRKGTMHYEVYHTNLGFVLWKKHLCKVVLDENILRADDGDSEDFHEILEYLAGAVTGHHGKPPETGEGIKKYRVKNYFTDEDIDAAAAFTRQAADILIPGGQGIFLPVRESEESVKKASWLIAGLAVLADWIGSDSNFFKMRSEHISLKNYWENVAMVNARDAVSKFGVAPAAVAPQVGFSKLFDEISKPSPLQRHLETCDISKEAQLFIIEDVTGSGKTEAALMLAHRLMAAGSADGIYVALPTMATANAMYERLSKSYRRLFAKKSEPSLILAHSAKKMVKRFLDSIPPPGYDYSAAYGGDEETASAQCSAWLADNRKKCMLADVGIGTVDQALLAILRSKHQSLRLFGLFGKLLIVDEVHAYDKYMNRLLKTLLEFHRELGGSAILLSATLPRKMRSELEDIYGGSSYKKSSVPPTPDYPLVTKVSCGEGTGTHVKSREGMRRRVGVKIFHDRDKVKNYLIESARRGQCACWIRNTVKDAIAAYESLKKFVPEDELLLFHARFSMGDRLDKEKEVLECFGGKSDSSQRAGKILIATQVVEQSLDLDFDVMVSDLALIDILIQRAGRLRRHARDAKGNRLKDDKAKDERGKIRLVVFGPKPVDKPNENWYKAFFEKAAYVYPFHGQLWLTARLLDKRGGWSMPNDARTLMESVYGENVKIPASLQELDDKAEGEEKAKESFAHLNRLKIDEGYKKTMRWMEDTQAVTRLGEISTTVRLAKRDGENLKPWYEEGERPWELSQLSVRNVLVNKEARHKDKALRKAVKKIKEQLPDKGKWSVLIPLVRVSDDLWQGEAMDINGEPVTLLYDYKIGLIVEKD